MTFPSLKKEFSLIQLLKSHIQTTLLVRTKQKLLSYRKLCWRVHKDGEDAKSPNCTMHKLILLFAVLRIMCAGQGQVLCCLLQAPRLAT